MRYKEMLIIILISMISTMANATLEEIEFQRMKTAKSTETISSVHEGFALLRANLRACEIQTNERLLPTTCYRALQLAADFNIEQEIELTQEKVDRICLINAAKTSELKNTISEELSARCSERASERVKMNLYRIGHEY